MKSMVQIYTTGPNDSTIYNRYTVQTGVLSIVPIGRMAYWRNRRIGGNWSIYYIIIYINSIIALAHSETF